MREFGRIETRFWSSSKVAGIGDAARLLLLYLITSPHSNSIGCYVLKRGYAMEDLGWPAARVDESLDRLTEAGLVDFDPDHALVRITGWWGHNRIENPNVAKAASKAIAALPAKSPVFLQFCRALSEARGSFKPHVWRILALALPVELRGTAPGSVLDTPPASPQAGARPQPRSAAAKMPVSAPAAAEDGAPSPRDKDNYPSDGKSLKEQGPETVPKRFRNGSEQVSRTKEPEPEPEPEREPEKNRQAESLAAPRARAASNDNGGPPGSKLGPKPQPTPTVPVGALIAAFDDARAEVWGEQHRRPWPAQKDRIVAQGWIDAGITPELVREVARRQFEKMLGRNGELPRMLSLLDGDLRAAATEAQRKAAAGPFDPERTQWQARAKSYRESGLWLDSWGFPPGHAACRMPPDLQETCAKRAG